MMVDRQFVIELLRLKHTFNQSTSFDLQNEMLRSEFFILHVLTRYHEESNLTVSQIAEILSVSDSAVSRTIRELNEKEWIKRSHDSNDRRLTHVGISESGKEKYNSVMNELVEEIQMNLDGYDEDRLKEFISIFVEFTDYISKVSTQNKQVNLKGASE